MTDARAFRCTRARQHRSRAGTGPKATWLLWRCDGRLTFPPGSAAVASILATGSLTIRYPRVRSGEWKEPLQLAGCLAVERGDAADGHLGSVESDGGESLFDLRSHDAGVDRHVCDHAYVCSAFRLSYLVLDDLPVLAERRAEHVRVDAH